MDSEGKRGTGPERAHAVKGTTDASLQEICEKLFFIRRGWLNGNHFVFNGRKKILIFVLLMKRGCPSDRLFDYLSKSCWFPAVVDRYFKGRYRHTYDALVDGLLERNIIRIEDGVYYANVER